MLNFALVARLLAWVVLVFYIARTGVTIINYQIYAIGYVPILNSQGMQNFISVLKDNPYYFGDMILSILSLLLRGVILHLVLHGISLGLNMIVETDINYRDKINEGGAQ